MQGPSLAKQLRRAVVLAPIGIAVFGASASASTTLPPRKPGFWETTRVMQMSMKGQSMGGDTPFVTAMCSDATTDAIEMKRMSGDGGKCSHFDIEGSGNTYTITGVCADPMGGKGAEMTTHGTITIESDTAMHVESDTQSPSMSGHMVGDSKWLGACPAGIIPGDVGHMINGKFEKLTNIKNLSKPAP